MYDPFMSIYFLESYYHKWVLNFVQSSLCIYWDGCGFFLFFVFFLVFQFVNLVHHIYWFSLLKNSCIHGTKPAWSFLYVVGFCLLGFCWGLFIFVHQWNWPLIFWFFYIIFVWFVIMVIMASEWVQEFFFLCNFLCLSSIGVASESESCSVASDSLWPHGL